MHAKVFSIQMLQYFSQIVPKVCTLVLFTVKELIYVHKDSIEGVSSAVNVILGEWLSLRANVGNANISYAVSVIKDARWWTTYRGSTALP